MRACTILCLVAFIATLAAPVAAEAPAPEESEADASPIEQDLPADDADRAQAERTEACVAAFTDAQRLRREGRLRQSRAQLVMCAQGECPLVLRDKCVPWLAEVEAAIPTIIVAAIDPSGRDTTDVRVTLDGIVIAEQLDGRPLAVDPGSHELRFDHPSALPILERLVIVERDKGRRIDVRFEAPALPMPPAPPSLPPPVRTERSHGSPLLWVGVAIAAVGVTIGTITGIIALDEASALDASCPEKTCPPALQGDYDTGVAYAHASTASFVIGGAGALLALGAWLLDDDDAKVRAWVTPAGAGVTGRF